MSFYLGQVRPKKRIPLKKAEALAEKIYDRLAPLTDFMMVAGSIRRQRSEIGDVEFVVLPKDLGSFIETLENIGYSGGNRKRVTLIGGIKVEIYLAHHPGELGAMAMAYTGDYLFNISMRSIAKRRGWKLDQYGIVDADTDEVLLQSPYEEDFFGALGVDYHTPEERSLAHRLPGKKSPSLSGLGPRDWSPRMPREVPGHVPRFEEILSKLDWDGEEWREPDYKDDFLWIWYGPGGRRGEHATMIEWESDGWRVAEYAWVGKEHSPRGQEFLKTSLFLSDEFLVEALWRRKGIGVGKEEIQANDEEWAKLAVSLGVADLNYHGGNEEWVESLP
jgi:hypothetical protein